MEIESSSKMQQGKYQKQSKLPLSNTSKTEATQSLNNKTFVFDSSDQHIKRILGNNGWKAVREAPALLKWVYQPKNNTFSELQKNTLINHFPHSHILTTKLGLCRTLRGERTAFINEFGKTHLRFYPRSYDLSQENQAFVKDFRQTAIANLSKKMMIALELSDERSFNELKAETSGYRNKEVNWLKQLRFLYQKKQIYSNGAVTSKSFLVNAKIFESLLYYLCLMFTLDCQVNEEIVSESQINILVAYSQFNPPYHSLQQHYEGDKSLAKNPSRKGLKLFFGLYSEIRKRFPWFRADGLRNIWVVKGSDSSRGRSIVLVSNLQELKMLNSGTKLIQKYVQDTWIIHQAKQDVLQKFSFLNKILSKKFDIRIWVLVRSFAPLQAYQYTEGYLRISQEEYQLLNINRDKTHLTNFSVNWKDTEADPQNSYILLSEFLQFLEDQGYKTKKQLMKQLHLVIKNTLQAADLAVTSSDKRCFQLFGFDILLDSQLRPWLLEVNMSPACKERGRLVLELQRMGKGLLCIIGLIQDNTNKSRWIRLDFGQAEPKKGKQKKEHINAMAKSECQIRPVLSKVRNLKTGQDEDPSLSRVNSLLPSIANSQSLHNKAEVFASQISTGLMAVGLGLSRKKFRSLDGYLAAKNAVIILQRHFLSYIKVKRQIERNRGVINQKLIGLSWLSLVANLNKIVKRGMAKCFKRMVKTGLKKKQFHIRKSAVKFDLNL